MGKTWMPSANQISVVKYQFKQYAWVFVVKCFFLYQSAGISLLAMLAVK